MSTLTVALATLSVNKMKMMGGNVHQAHTLNSIMSRLTVAVATLSANKLNGGWQCIHQVL